MSQNGFIQLNRCEKIFWLLRHKPNVVLLLTLIALRACRTKKYKGLEIGQAWIGDHEACGLSRQEYRTALDYACKEIFIKIEATQRSGQFSTIDPTTKKTNSITIKGTIVKLLDNEVWNINQEITNDTSTINSTINSTIGLTIEQPSSNHHLTTKKKEKKEKKEKNDPYQESDRLDCSYVHKSESANSKTQSSTCEHTQQSSSLFNKIENFAFDIATYRLPTGLPLSDRMQRSIKKYTDQNYEKFLRNLILLEEEWGNGKKPAEGRSYEQMLQGYISLDIAQKRINRDINRAYVRFVKAENPFFPIVELKGVIHLKKYPGQESYDSFNLEMDPQALGDIIDQYLKQYKEHLNELNSKR